MTEFVEGAGEAGGDDPARGHRRVGALPAARPRPHCLVPEVVFTRPDERRAPERGGALLGQLLLGRGEQVPVLLVAPSRPHPGPAQAVAELVRPMALAGVDAAAHADRGVAGVGLDGNSREGLALGDRGALGADLGGDLGDRAGLGRGGRPRGSTRAGSGACAARGGSRGGGAWRRCSRPRRARSWRGWCARRFGARRASGRRRRRDRRRRRR